MRTSEFQVTGMTCGHCEAAGRSEVAHVEGVESLDLSLETGRLVVHGADGLDPATIVAAVDEAGYDAVVVS